MPEIKASWYGPGFHGRKTASGTTYNEHDVTAAHKKLPFGSLMRVTNKETGRSAFVPITDRGPYIPGRDLDLSRGAANLLGTREKGVATVQMEPAINRDPVQGQKEFIAQQVAIQKALTEENMKLWDEGARFSGEIQRRAEEQRRQDPAARVEDYGMAMQGLQTRNPAPIVDYVNRYGDPKTNLKDIQFDPAGKDPGLIVDYQDGRSSYYKTPEEFYSGFMFLMNPEVEAKLQTQQPNERKPLQ